MPSKRNYRSWVTSEKDLHSLVVSYLKASYPQVLFNSDMGGVRLSARQGAQVASLRSGRGWPDIFIAECRSPYGGLWIEIKTRRENIYTKSGRLRKNTHIEEQAEMLNQLRARGYRAEFGCGFEEIKKIIDTYLGD